MIASRLVRDAMRLCFLAERRYAPYPKWLEAPDWRQRDHALIPVWEALARRHNRLGITPPLLSTINATWLTPAMHRSPIGGIDLMSDNTDLLEDPAYRAGVRAQISSGG